MLKRHFPLLALPLLATSCLAFDPPPPPTPSNSVVLVMKPAILNDCETVTWTLTYLRAGQDVTAEARYLLGHRTGSVQTPQWTLSEAQDGTSREGYWASPIDQAGELITRAEFSDAVTHDVTCVRTGQRISLTRHRVREVDGLAVEYRAVEVTTAGGHLTLN